MPGAAPCLACSRRYHGFVVLGLGGCEWCLAARRVNMPMVEVVGETRDNTGTPGDHDIAHVWGNWRVCLTTMQQARLTILRGHVKDHEGAIEGDSDYVIPLPSGLLVPVANWPDEA